MKKFIISLCLFFALALMVVIHSVVLLNFGKRVEALSEKVIACAEDEDWEKTSDYLDKIGDEWEKKRLWAAVTIKTNVIEEIDISLKQSKAMAKLKAKPDFFSEFIMLERLIHHIPHQEGFHLEEIL